ncbi:hypothetical protein GCM10025792_52720 [Pseudonocardia tropica]|uniref:DUF3558 family protein n=1 Tax=Pseudonocardia tropica TaxID=681289 RepID=UPI00337FFE85
MLVPAARRIALGSLAVVLTIAVTSCGPGATPPEPDSPRTAQPGPIDVTDKHPCDLLPAPTLHTLELRDPRKNDAVIRGTGAPSCGFFGTGTPRIDINLQFLPLAANDLRSTESSSGQTRGYDVIENDRSTSRLAVCEAVADTDGSTSVRAQASVPTDELREAGSPGGAACDRAHEALGEALAVLAPH